jgi:hypothetical protein
VFRVSTALCSGSQATNYTISFEFETKFENILAGSSKLILGLLMEKTRGKRLKWSLQANKSIFSFIPAANQNQQEL